MSSNSYSSQYMKRTTHTFPDKEKEEEGDNFKLTDILNSNAKETPSNITSMDDSRSSINNKNKLNKINVLC